MITSTYRKLFGPTRKELIELVIKRLAVAAGDVAQTEQSLACYDELLQETDHTTDWWAYADYKQKQHDLRIELNVANERLKRIEEEFKHLGG